jgi:phosphomannomutase
LEQDHREIALGKAFGTAGVRGVFNQTQTPEQIYELAETIASVFGKGSYGVGWDGRKVSALLARTVMSAVNAAESDVLSFGLVPTPVIAFGARSRGCHAGFAVTASHNPPEFSGVKVFSGRGVELAKPDEERIESALGSGAMRSTGRFGSTTPDEYVIDDYVEGLVSRHKPSKEELRIAVDCASGPGGLVTPRVLRSLGYDVVPVNAQISWRFPARPPEPTPTTLSDFARMVTGLSADFGFAHDGDADRLVMVDRKGNVVPDSIMVVLAMRGLEASGGTVVISENTSMVVQEEAARLGFKVLRSRVGKSFAMMEEVGGVFATEPSKVVDPSWGPWEDGMNGAAMIAGVLASERELLDRLMAETKWRYRQVNLDVAVHMPSLAKKAKKAFREFGVFEERTLDGYKLVFNDGSWAMFRPSGTEPKTRIYCESKDQVTLDKLSQLGRRCVESSLAP